MSRTYSWFVLLIGACPDFALVLKASPVLVPLIALFFTTSLGYYLKIVLSHCQRRSLLRLFLHQSSCFFGRRVSFMSFMHLSYYLHPAPEMSRRSGIKVWEQLVFGVLTSCLAVLACLSWGRKDSRFDCLTVFPSRY